MDEIDAWANIIAAFCSPTHTHTPTNPRNAMQLCNGGFFYDQKKGNSHLFVWECMKTVANFPNFFSILSFSRQCWYSVDRFWFVFYAFEIGLFSVCFVLTVFSSNFDTFILFVAVDAGRFCVMHKSYRLAWIIVVRAHVIMTLAMVLECFRPSPMSCTRRNGKNQFKISIFVRFAI